MHQRLERPIWDVSACVWICLITLRGQLVMPVCVCVLGVRVRIRSYSYVPISIFTDSVWYVWNNVWWQVHTYPGKWRCVHAEKQLLSISHTHTHKHIHIHFLWWMGLSILVTTVQMARHVIKHPSALLHPSLFTLLTTLSLSHIHTDTSPIPGTIIIYSTFLQ